MSYLAGEIERYRKDAVAFVQDFCIVGQIPPYQKELIRSLSAAFTIPPVRFYAPPLDEAEMEARVLKMEIVFDRRLFAFGVPGIKIGTGLPQTGPWGRHSRGWRRHVRRMKAEKRR